MRSSVRRVGILCGNRIPFARSNSAYAHASNHDMLTAALDGLIARAHLEGELLGEVVGLYLNPPERAVVLCVDEKSQIQVLNRTAPILPMLPGTPQRATHDYRRAGTSSLYAALDITTGQVIGSLHARHRAIEFKKFLNTLDREVPPELDIHVILDNSSTHKTPAIQKWLTAHPRFVLHFTPRKSDERSNTPTTPTTPYTPCAVRDWSTASGTSSLPRGSRSASLRWSDGSSDRRGVPRRTDRGPRRLGRARHLVSSGRPR